MHCKTALLKGLSKHKSSDSVTFTTYYVIISKLRLKRMI